MMWIWNLSVRSFIGISPQKIKIIRIKLEMYVRFSLNIGHPDILIRIWWNEILRSTLSATSQVSYKVIYVVNIFQTRYVVIIISIRLRSDTKWILLVPGFGTTPIYIYQLPSNIHTILYGGRVRISINTYCCGRW